MFDGLIYFDEWDIDALDYQIELSEEDKEYLSVEQGE